MRPRNLLKKLKNGFVLPHWIGQTDDFWYRRDTAQGHEFVIVHAADGRKERAFDHQAMAAAFSKASGTNVAPEQLPFEDMAFNSDRTSIHVTADNTEYDCSLKPAACSGGKPVFPPPPIEVSFFTPNPALDKEKPSPDEGVLVSPDKNWGVFTCGYNLCLRDYKTRKDTQLTRDGAEHFSYGGYLDVFEDAAIPRERVLAAGHHLLPMESYWSPDSRTVIVPRGDERFVADYPYVETVPKDGSFRPKLHKVRMALVGEKPPTLEWFAFHVPSGTYTRINFPYDKLLAVDPDGLPIRKKWWSADNHHLYALAVGENMESALLFDVELATGKVRTMVEEHMMPRMEMSPDPWDSPDVWVSPTGKDVIWFSERDGWGIFIFMTGRQAGSKIRLLAATGWYAILSTWMNSASSSSSLSLVAKQAILIIAICTASTLTALASRCFRPSAPTT
jgi:hypothetical protein